jgi:hypothetical protein
MIDGHKLTRAKVRQLQEGGIPTAIWDETQTAWVAGPAEKYLRVSKR